MCGIAGFHVKDPAVIKKHEGVELLVDELLKKIEHRGRHATGFVSVGFNGRVVLDKAATDATEFIKDRDRIPEGVRTVLLHTRHATQGPKENLENNHPVIFGTCFAVHNGHINNDSDVFKELDLERTAEVDSLAIAASANFEGLGEIEDIQHALERLEGPMATAIIDPVNHPARLILAKGKSSPLYVIDTPKFIVWASTKPAILESWGKVLGTPPNEKKLEEVKEGSIIIVDDATVTRETFKVKERPFASANYDWRKERDKHNKRKEASGTNGSGFGFGMPNISQDANHPVAQAKEAIAAFIKAGGTARNFDDHQNGMYDDADFKDVNGDRQWHPCWGCNRLILAQDFLTSQWGRICTDCHTATEREVARNEAEMQGWDEENVCAGTAVPRISPADRDALEIWADHELSLHREVIESMSKDCGSYYSPEAIEFLSFYTTPEYREVAGSAVNDLITELRELYEVTYLDITHELIDRIDDAVAERDEVACAVPEAKKATQPLLLEAAAHTWGFCHLHNRAHQPSNGGCPQCAEDDRITGDAHLAAILDGAGEEAETSDAPSTEIGPYLPFERGRESVITHTERPYKRSTVGAEESTEGNADNDSGGEVIDLPRCGACGTYVLRATEKSCTVCRESEKNDSTDDGKCDFCYSGGVNFVVSLGGKKYTYCGACYSSCGKLVHEPNNAVRLCHAETKHMLANGMRVCHTHVRSQSGSLSDTTLKKRGATIMEVKS